MHDIRLSERHCIEKTDQLTVLLLFFLSKNFTVKILQMQLLKLDILDST